ncbi:ABC-2 family transporter protein [Candidatus Dependentiae bacterium]|nr:ABC-2 family transporter protein [Candidatus Dependentiae bacterium]
MFLSTPVKYLKFSILMVKTNIKSAAAYKTSFIMQIIGMMVGDTSFAIMWTIFFKRFPIINGWQSNDMMVLIALSSINFGLCLFFAGGTWELAKKIANGELDQYIAAPQNLLWSVATSKSLLPGFGEVLFGIIIYIMFGQLSFLPVITFISLCLITSIILFNFQVITQSMAFYFGNFEDAAEQLYVALAFCTYTPQGSFTGFFKIIIFTIIPGFFVAELPVKLIKTFNIYYFLLLLAFTVATYFLAIFVFKKGLKRYESGSLMNVKM